MKRKKVFPIMAMLLLVLVGSCKKDLYTTSQNSNLASQMSSQDKSVALQTKKGTLALAVVNLGVAGQFAILSKSGITDVYKSTITVDVGSSPITGAAILVRCAEVTGTIYT